MDLSKVKDREALKARREPYWHRIRPGCFIGYRPSAKGGAGTWIARSYDEQTNGYKLKALGDFGDQPSRERFATAKTEAEAYATRIESGGELKVETVEQACRKYAESRAEAEARFRRYVYPDAIAKVKLAKLRRHHLTAWRERLQSTPALVSRRKEGEAATRPRAAASINRDMTVLRAALNRVLAPGTPDTEAAWQEALRPIRNADRQRTLYLDRTQRKALLAALPADAEPFFRAMCLLPLRPGAVASLTAGNFDKRTSELSIGRDKSGKPRRILLPPVAANLFAEQAKGKLPAAPLFMRANGAAWEKNSWKLPIAAAAKAANLPAGVTAYTLRHSTITDLATGDLSLLTIAQISDTSVEMIERHYGHLIRTAATEALAGLAL
ncbi:tyrosine-type recombinase/integrase [Sphingomonas baiyangensis]|nr:integrase [Sphingomonas baiyangensis]